MGSFIQNINKLANELGLTLEELNRILDEMKSIKTNVEENKQQAQTASQSAQSNANKIQEQLDRKATTTVLGSVVLATNDDIDKGTTNKVITSDLLKNRLDNISNNLQDANTKTKGIIKVATNEEVQNQEGNNAITPSNLKYFPFMLDSSNFLSDSTISGISYLIFKVNETTQYMFGFGMVNTLANEPLKLIFPKDIITNSLGISTSLFGSKNNNDIVIDDLTSKYITISIRDKEDNLVNSKGFINIQAKLDVSLEVNEPTNVKVNVQGNKVDLTWEE